MPKTTVAAIVTETEGHPTKVLLTRRLIEPFKGQWCLPGGHIDPNESIYDAVIREIKEETGLDFAAHFFRPFNEIIPEHSIHAVVMVFEGVGIGTLKAQPDEVSEMKWFTLDEARSFQLAFTHNGILDKYADSLTKRISDGLRSEMLAEFSALRDETTKRMDMRQQMLTFALIIAGTLITVGLEQELPSALLLYPILSLFLALSWMQSDTRIGEIGAYIGTKIESQLKGIRWENTIRVKSKGQQYRNVEVYTAGLFLTIGLLTIILAITMPKFSFSVGETILLIFDILSMILIIPIVLYRRVKIYKPKTWQQDD